MQPAAPAIPGGDSFESIPSSRGQAADDGPPGIRPNFAATTEQDKNAAVAKKLQEEQDFEEAPPPRHGKLVGEENATVEVEHNERTRNIEAAGEWEDINGL